MARTLHHLRFAGADVLIEADDGATLLEVARQRLGVRSASRGCDDGKCGACRLLVDGALVNACTLRWDGVREGAHLEAYEQLEGEPDALRAVLAFGHERPTRCRLCTGGLGVTAVALARAGRARDPDAVEKALETATCMCTGRGSLRRALLA
jgi:aldehyde oxidoreductase